MSNQDNYRMTTEVLEIAPTATQGITAVPGQKAIHIQTIGATLNISGVTSAISTAGYRVTGTKEFLNWRGPMFAYAFGATATVHVLRMFNDKG